ncbi:chloride channel protein [Uliginosibacterium sp. 31-12]|uniref:chloride channel protein n=1 Tax=Uliginosibacterium sp. 31-12 TaxID=3062781 RepID=UPI0026E458FB|nr:chloride channel protein [Uliginosibacterium sp. 31-12]MDO6387069.1 chloride channel protein [Uliginosibacterium sp. 31-12]
MRFEALMAKLPRSWRIPLRAGRWQGRGLFGALALLAACGVILLAVLADWAALMHLRLMAMSPWLALLWMPAGFALSSWLSLRIFAGTQGSGVPQTVAAALDHGVRMPGFRAALGKLLLTPLAMLWGAAAGREGPSIFLGAAIMQGGARWSYLRHAASPRQLLVAGGAIGVAAAFNTPLAGIMFAIEELSRKRSFNANATTLMAVVLAGLASTALLGNYLYFGRSAATLAVFSELDALLLCGVLGGLAGGLFSRAAINVERLLPARLRSLRVGRPMYFASACGLCAALLGLASGGLTWGTGYEEARQAVTSAASMPLYYSPLKMLSLLITFASSIPAGIFAPSLAIGAGLSGFVEFLCPGSTLGALALLCMAAYLGGLTQAPITSFVVVLEMSSNQQLMIPLILAATLGHVAARASGAEPVFYGLARRLPLPSGSP